MMGRRGYSSEGLRYDSGLYPEERRSLQLELRRDEARNRDGEKASELRGEDGVKKGSTRNAYARRVTRADWMEASTNFAPAANKPLFAGNGPQAMGGTSPVRGAKVDLF
jgi:hypothetical protein